MTDFSLYHIGRWSDGEGQNIRTTTYVVSYDGKHNAYQIDKNDLDDFYDWVAQHWDRDNESQGESEIASDYLDRIGVSVREL